MLEEITSSRLGEKYYRYTHSSGVTVLLYPMKGYSTITAQFSVKFGSIDNCCSIDGGAPVRIPDGTAHYLEHKLFESPEKEAFARFAETGASCNAGTSYDSTRYYFSCSANFEKNLEILLDFVQHPYFTPENVEKERGIITQDVPRQPRLARLHGAVPRYVPEQSGAQRHRRLRGEHSAHHR